MFRVPAILLLGLLFLPTLPSASGEEIVSEKQRFQVEPFLDGLEVPWGMVKLPDGRFLITERKGDLRVVEGGKLLTEPVEGIPEVWAKGQGGLLDIRLHPDYAENGWIYLAFSKPLPKGALTSIVRFQLKGNRAENLETIFEPPAEDATEAGAHFGSRMAFDGEGHLFFSIGDRGDVTTPANNAQRLDNVKGKIHRLMDDGRIPADNPFVQTPGARASIWSYGNRNPQGLVFDPQTKKLWETEHGPKGGDELNLIEKGKNYGWPVVTFGINYNGTPITDHTTQEGMAPPVHHWTPSIAPCGLAIYQGEKFPHWQGNLFSGALAHRKLVRLALEGNTVTEEEILLKNLGRIRDVRCFDDGFLYLLYEQPGRIVRLAPVGTDSKD